MTQIAAQKLHTNVNAWNTPDWESTPTQPVTESVINNRRSLLVSRGRACAHKRKRIPREHKPTHSFYN